ncbi:MAG: 50S ribosomal protein L11 methyltransferase [Vicinamibacteria bacterium]|nr:50S ribosomal protein L11 methyltransferase [Vicinamibacteria bacterium]
MPFTEAQIYDHTVRLLRDHEALLQDRVRNRAFHRALERRVKPGSTVLDIGAGVGIWAIVAARLGAGRVVAIEEDELLCGLIRRLAADCGVGARVEAVWGHSTQVALPREFDLVVSETIGDDGFEEQIVPIMMDARARFLRPGGVILPETVGLVAAAARLHREVEALPLGLPFDFAHFDALRLHAPIRFRDRKGLRLLTKASRLVEIDLRKDASPSAIEDMRAAWTVEDASPINAFLVWAESRLAPGIRLSTRRTTSWAPAVYRIEPAAAGPGEVEFRLSLTAKTTWTSTVTRGSASETRTYSPAEAAKELLLDLKARQPLVSPQGEELITRLV